MQNSRKISLIVVHCSATRITQNFTVEDLEASHRARGFTGIGYHFYITKDGVIYPCRPENKIGAHARHYNAHSIGVCYEGGLDENGQPADTRTPAGKKTIILILGGDWKKPVRMDGKKIKFVKYFGATIR